MASDRRITLSTIASALWVRRKNHTLTRLPHRAGWDAIKDSQYWLKRGSTQHPKDGYRMWAHANPKEYAKVDEAMIAARDQWLRANGVWVTGSRPAKSHDRMLLRDQWMKTNAIKNATEEDFRAHDVATREELVAILVDSVDRLLQYGLTETPAAHIAAYSVLDDSQDADDLIK